MSDIRAVFFDLDETIYAEADFKRSGFCAVARWLGSTGHASESAARAFLLGALNRHGPLYPRAFHDLAHGLALADRLVPEMVHVFREHAPRISPYPDFARVAAALDGVAVLGVITDGLAAVQRRKIAALGVDRWDAQQLILVTDALEPPTDKHDVAVFQLAAARARVAPHECAYVGDNPHKDFHHPALLGWRTIRLRRGVYADATAGDPADADIHSFDELPQLLNDTTSRAKHPVGRTPERQTS